MQPSPAPASPKLYGLDHLRAAAIIMVFSFHYGRLFASPQWLTDHTGFGWSGVDLFFVLSGYLIASQLFRTIAATGGFSFRDFFIKRFFRIIPAYLAIVSLYFLLPMVRERESPAPLWKYLSFTQNLGLDLRYQGTFSHAWSLCIEEQFYLCLPLLLWLLLAVKAFRHAGWLLLLFFIAGFAARLYTWHSVLAPVQQQDDFWRYWYEYMYYPTYSRLDGLLAGVSIAALLQFRPRVREKLAPYGNYIFAAGLLILTAAYVVCQEEMSYRASIWGFPLTDIGYGCIVLAAVCPSCFLYRFRSRATSAIAGISYGLYLVHKITIHLTQTYITGTAKESNLMLVYGILATITAAILLRFTIERPALALRKKILRPLSAGKTGKAQM